MRSHIFVSNVRALLFIILTPITVNVVNQHYDGEEHHYLAEQCINTIDGRELLFQEKHILPNLVTRGLQCPYPYIIAHLVVKVKSYLSPRPLQLHLSCHEKNHTARNPYSARKSSPPSLRRSLPMKQ